MSMPYNGISSSGSPQEESKYFKKNFLRYVCINIETVYSFGAYHHWGLKGTVSWDFKNYLKVYDVECVFFDEPLMVFILLYCLVIFLFKTENLFTILQIHF